MAEDPAKSLQYAHGYGENFVFVCRVVIGYYQSVRTWGDTRDAKDALQVAETALVNPHTMYNRGLHPEQAENNEPYPQRPTSVMMWRLTQKSLNSKRKCSI